MQPLKFKALLCYPVKCKGVDKNVGAGPCHKTLPFWVPLHSCHIWMTILIWMPYLTLFKTAELCRKTCKLAKTRAAIINVHTFKSSKLHNAQGIYIFLMRTMLKSILWYVAEQKSCLPSYFGQNFVEYCETQPWFC